MLNVVEALRSTSSRQPGRPALVMDAAGERISYGELAERVERIAARLRAAGVVRGERCGLLAPQGPGFVLHALGILAAGACLVPIAGELGRAGVEAVCAEARLSRLVRVASADERLRVEAVPAEPFAHEEAFRALDPCYLRFTSGTTSRRKGVVLGHAAVQARLDAANAALRVGPGDVVLWLLPMAHHFVVSLLLYLREGATVLLPASTLARPALRLGVREGATFLYASPFHHQLLARDGGPETLDALRLAISTAEGLRRDVAEAFRARFGVPLVQALGVIECGLPLWNLAEAARKPEALGRPLPGFEVWLRDEAGAEVKGVGPSRTGELCIRGPGLFDAYLSPWTPAAQLLAPDGFRTGDVAWRDEEGDLHLAGRRTNRINVAGMKFFCEEVEAVLDVHPEVRRSRVSARAHAHLGEVPVAQVVARDATRPPASDVLRAFCRERLPAYAVPREIELVASLSTTPSGKLLRWGRELDA